MLRVAPDCESAPMGAESRPDPPLPVPGAAISNLREVRSGGGASGLGALGFLAVRAGSRDWSRLLLVSNHHVLFAHGARPGEAIFQPRYREAGGRLLFEADPRPVATLAEGGFEGDWRYAYPGEEARSYFVDCAAAMLTGRAAAAAPQGEVLFAGIARASPLDALQGREIGVTKLGRDRGIAGRLVGTEATVALADGSRRSNNLVIRGLNGRPFASEGDSGALVLDSRHRAIGLVWGVNLEDPRIAYASHIHPVLDYLKLVPCRHAVGGAHGAG